MLKTPIALQKVLVLPFIFLITLSVLVTSYFTWEFSRETTLLLGTQISQQSAYRVEEKLQSYFNYAQTFNESLKEPIAYHLLDIQDRAALLDYITYVVGDNPDIATLSFAYPDGAYMGVSNSSNGDLLKKVAGPATDRMFYTYNLTNNQLIQQRPDYDARQRAWFIEAKDSTLPVWSSVFEMYSSGKLGMTYAEALYDDTQAFIGVVGTDIVFDDLNQQLHNIRLTQNSYLFILDDVGNVIAQSNLDEEHGQSTLYKFEQSDSELLKQAVNFIYAQNGFKGKAIHSRSEFAVDGKRSYYSVNSIPYTYNNGLNWHIGVVIPESDFLGKVDEVRENTFYIWLVSFCLSVILGLLITYLIGKEINSLRNRVRRIEKTGGLYEHESHHIIKEIHELSEAFSKMSRRLYESYLDVKMSNGALENIVSTCSMGLAEVNEQLKLSMKTDALTGLPDKQSFDCFLQFYWHHFSNIEKDDMSLILCKVDTFRQFNEALGSVTSKDCLQKIAQMIVKTSKEMDVVARYSSETFVIMTPNKTPEAAVALAKLILKELDALNNCCDQTQYPEHHYASLTIGIASTSDLQIQHKGELIKAAESALALAKDKGKNTYVVYDTKTAEADKQKHHSRNKAEKT